MAASKSYFARGNYRFLASDRDAPAAAATGDSVFELDESDVWSTERSASPECRKAVASGRVSRKQSGGGKSERVPASLPVNVPDWSKILKDEYRENRRRDSYDDDDFDEKYGDDRVPPHEFLARQLATARIASFSVHEGVGRTLKGRDLSKSERRCCLAVGLFELLSPKLESPVVKQTGLAANLLELLILHSGVKMLPRQTENQSLAGDPAKEADVHQCSKKKTKRGLSVRDGEPMEMEEDGRINGKNMERKTVNAKGKSGGNQEGNNSKFNKEGFKFWDNSRFGALENLEEELEEETQEKYVMMERPDGPTGAILAGKGKRPQVQITEAQVLNDKATTANRVNTARRQPTYKAKEGNMSTDKSKKQVNQAAEIENHTVVQGFDKGNRVERTMITKEGSRTEVFNFQAGMGDHHQDPPDGEQTTEDGSMGDPMADVVFAEGQCSSGLGGAE
nr:Classical arabinogalactan protein [Ipomoea batatas]